MAIDPFDQGDFPLATLATPDPTTGVEPAHAPLPPVGGGPGFGVVAGLLAPALAAPLAGILHRQLPDAEPASPSRAYHVALTVILTVMVLSVVFQAIWPRLRPGVRRRGPLVAGAIGLLMLWDVVTLKLAWLPLPFFPDPNRILEALWDDRVVLAEATAYSLRLLLTGYAGGVLAGLVTGVLVGWSRPVRYWAMPLLKLVGPIPATAYVPLVMTASANANISGALLIGLAVWFPMTMLTASGIANVPTSYLDVARTLGAGRSYLIFRVALPAAMPGIFLGLFMGLGAAFLTLVVAETVGVKSGLAWYMSWQQSYLEYPRVYAALAIMAAFFSGLMTLLFAVRDRLLAWQKEALRW